MNPNDRWSSGLIFRTRRSAECRSAARDSGIGCTRARRGRALVECVVAMLLLALTALSLAATVRGTLALADDAMLIAHAQAMATTRVEDVMAMPCGTGAFGTDQLPRLNVLWQQSGSARDTQLHLDVTLARSPIALASGPIEFALEAGGICP